MKAVGFAIVDAVPGSTSSWTEEIFSNVFADFCDSLAHQREKFVVSVAAPDRSDIDLQFQQILAYIETQPGGFLVVVPDATHVSEDLEGICLLYTSPSPRDS